MGYENLHAFLPIPLVSIVVSLGRIVLLVYIVQSNCWTWYLHCFPVCGNAEKNYLTYYKHIIKKLHWENYFTDRDEYFSM